MKKIILASTSSYRKELLSKLHWPFEAMKPDVDEDIYKNESISPAELSAKLSLLKADNVFGKNPDAIVIGSDQVCSFGNQILSKPLNFERALGQLAMLSGNKHQLLTSVTIKSQEKTLTWTNTTTLWMRKLNQEDITRYLNIDTPYDCAGSYKLEEMGIKLFEKIEMSDHTSIIGLPLIEISNILINDFGLKF